MTSADDAPDAARPAAAGPLLPIVSVSLSGLTILLAPCMGALAPISGALAAGVGYLAYRRTRAGTPQERNLGLVAATLGGLSLAAGLAVLAIALVVSGPAIFTG